MKTVDHSYEQALIMHDNVHIHVIMNIIMTPTCRILKKFVHACVVKVIHTKALPGSVMYVEHRMKLFQLVLLADHVCRSRENQVFDPSV